MDYGPTGEELEKIQAEHEKRKQEYLEKSKEGDKSDKDESNEGEGSSPTRVTVEKDLQKGLDLLKTDDSNEQNSDDETQDDNTKKIVKKD